MKVTKTTGICYECKKEFKEGYEINFNKKFFNKVRLCSCCACSLYSNFASVFVPKSPKNINIRTNKENHKIKNK